MAAKDTDDGKTEEQEADVTLDMSQAAVKKMIAEARERGYITYDQLNQVLPPDQVSSEQIEDVMSMLSEMGINVIENEEAEEGEDEGGRGRRDLDLARGRRLDHDQPRSSTAPTTRCACICARWARSNCCRREGEIAIAKRIEAGRNTMIAGPLRKPADLPGDHHLARRTSQRRHPAARRHRPRDHLRQLAGRRRRAEGAGRRWRRRRHPVGQAGCQGARARARRRRQPDHQCRGRRRGRRTGQHVARRDGGRAEAAGAGDAGPHRPRLCRSWPRCRICACRRR